MDNWQLEEFIFEANFTQKLFIWALNTWSIVRLFQRFGRTYHVHVLLYIMLQTDIQQFKIFRREICLTIGAT
jgi:hypothetical protein